jgi:hypothetical protein
MRGTHTLESKRGKTSQDTKHMGASEGHSRPGEPRKREKSRHEKNTSQEGALTVWKASMERQLGKWNKCEPKRDTHVLESRNGVSRQDMK